MFDPKIFWAGVSEKLSGGEMGRQLVTAEIAAIRDAACVVPAWEEPPEAAEPLPLVETGEKLVLTKTLLTKSKSIRQKVRVPWNFGKSG